MNDGNTQIKTMDGDDPLVDTKDKLLRKITSLEEQVYAVAQAIDRHRAVAEETNILIKRQQSGKLWAWFKNVLKHAAAEADKIRIE